MFKSTNKIFFVSNPKCWKNKMIVTNLRNFGQFD